MNKALSFLMNITNKQKGFAILGTLFICFNVLVFSSDSTGLKIVWACLYALVAFVSLVAYAIYLIEEKE